MYASNSHQIKWNYVVLPQFLVAFVVMPHHILIPLYNIKFDITVPLIWPSFTMNRIHNFVKMVTIDLGFYLIGYLCIQNLWTNKRLKLSFAENSKQELKSDGLILSGTLYFDPSNKLS